MSALLFEMLTLSIMSKVSNTGDDDDVMMVSGSAELFVVTTSLTL